MLSAAAPDELEDEKSPKGQEKHPGHWRPQHRPRKLVGGGCWRERHSHTERPFLVRPLGKCSHVFLPQFPHL